MGRLQNVCRTVRRELDAYRRVLRDPRTPKASKWLLAIALAYLASPIDLIPDWIPAVGHLDDAILVPALVALALRWIPPEVMMDARAAAENGKGEPQK